ncbi:hypothetical protein [Aporhodopirellula aestuarii]|uniref:Uncharacterized protein n=1 Tax=Aporhodopirellula aestuarii TaxID=2950107 RepID=A0ABT0UD94_9BACT|nr:hypothetical protein [Aporhodopirellula aestuarii]MCM2375013.1 hypothetical protein [Aporhodopirellula aestuarii]
MWPLTNGLRCLTGPEAALFRGGIGMMVIDLVTELNTEPEDGHPSYFDDDNVDDFGFSAPRWYSMWEPGQRVWLLERVTTSLLAARSAPPPSAIFEATIEAVYVKIADLIAMEITTGTPIQRGSWRGSLLDAYVQRCPHDSLLGALQFEATTIDPCLPPSVTRQWNAAQASSDDGESDSPDAQPSTASKDDASRRKQKSRADEPDWMAWWTSVIERLVDATYGPRLYRGAEEYRDGDPKLLQRFLRSKGVNEKFMHRIPPLRSRSQTQAAVGRLRAIVFKGD